MPELLTVKEVAEKLKVTEYTVRERLSIPYIDLNEGKGKKRNMCIGYVFQKKRRMIE